MIDLAQRPAPPESVHEGFHYEAVEEEHWETPAVGSGRCRWGASRYQKACGKSAIATLWRSRFTMSRGMTHVPWDYCAEHLFDRWIEDGKVMGWRLVEDAS